MRLSLFHPPLHQLPLCFPWAPKRGGDGNPVSIGPVTPSHALQVATFNARRLWLHDEAIHVVFQCCLGFFSLRTSVFVASRRQMQVISPHSLWIKRTHIMDLVGPEDGRRCCLDANSWSSGLSVDEMAHFWRVCVCPLILCPPILASM